MVLLVVHQIDGQRLFYPHILSFDPTTKQKKKKKEKTRKKKQDSHTNISSSGQARANKPFFFFFFFFFGKELSGFLCVLLCTYQRVVDYISPTHFLCLLLLLFVYLSIHTQEDELEERIEDQTTKRGRKEENTFTTE